MGREQLFQDSRGNWWDISVRGVWTLKEAAPVEEEGPLYTQATAWSALTAEDSEAAEEWLREQLDELPDAFAHVPASIRIPSALRLAA